MKAKDFTDEWLAESLRTGRLRGAHDTREAKPMGPLPVAPERRQSPGRAEVEADIKPPRVRSQLEVRFEQQLVTHGLPPFVTEHYHIPGRDFRLDFAWPSLRIGVEVQGGAHRIKGRFAADIPKRALALIAGWRVLEVDRAAVRDETGIEWLKKLMEAV